MIVWQHVTFGTDEQLLRLKRRPVGQAVPDSSMSIHRGYSHHFLPSGTGLTYGDSSFLMADEGKGIPHAAFYFVRCCAAGAAWDSGCFTRDGGW